MKAKKKYKIAIIIFILLFLINTFIIINDNVKAKEKNDLEIKTIFEIEENNCIDKVSDETTNIFLIEDKVDNAFLKNEIIYKEDVENYKYKKIIENNNDNKSNDIEKNEYGDEEFFDKYEEVPDYLDNIPESIDSLEEKNENLINDILEIIENDDDITINTDETILYKNELENIIEIELNKEIEN